MLNDTPKEEKEKTKNNMTAAGVVTPVLARPESISAQ
jgi:hypothetical protein